MATIAIVPVKRFALAKSRLAERFGPDQRRAIAEAMVSDVLGALITSRELAGVLVVTNEPAVIAIAELLGADVEADLRESGQSAAAVLGIARALREGYERALLLPGDCPALDRDELDALLRARESERSVVIVPDRHETGTNALLLSPPDAIVPAFGPGSFERHCRLARAAALEPVIERPPTLLLDIDTPADVAALLAGPRDRAPRTRAAYLAAER